MVQINAGLKKLTKRETLPPGPYSFRITRIIISKPGQGPDKKGTGEGVGLIVTKAQDDELVGNRSYKYILNYVTENCIGLTQILKSLRLLEVPSGEHGENDTQNLIGLEFDAEVTVGPDKNGVERNEIAPDYDSEWFEEISNCSEEEMEERIEEERGGGKKKTKKKAAKRTPKG